MLHWTYLFLYLFFGCAKRVMYSTGWKHIANRTGWERIETIQLEEEHPDLVHGAEGDNYDRKREV